MKKNGKAKNLLVSTEKLRDLNTDQLANVAGAQRCTDVTRCPSGVTQCPTTRF